MMTVPELKKLINFAIRKKITSFKLDNFEFNLSGTDPKRQDLDKIRKDLDDIKQVIQKHSLALSFKPKQ